ncbi:helix-turn-helix domain-containing protein [Paratissierella segnis]|jgi:transposase-like protein|uniref:Helix-turn-helix domain-containing protein n=1 Tax=Paratissierella segnis TaxID=2763679 RepID=A0A926EUK6_9FIRM|nr:helix-turn-helix domain-containing protein [Paratissierella segnis]MBC8586744.1 helix-turn-helix domain-containing protein [Paratissierella segnis]
MARPRKVIDMDIVEKLASEGYTVEEIAAKMDVNRSTLYRRKKFLETYYKGYYKFNTKVKDAINKKIQAGDVKTLLYLADKRKIYKTELEEIELKMKEIELKIKEKQLNNDDTDGNFDIVVTLKKKGSDDNEQD